jgi:DNA polymerase-3 subunit epsilon
MNILFLDLETTGLEVHRAKICQLGIIYKDKGKSILVNPGIQIPEGASKIHGIYDHMVKDSPSFEGIAMKLYEIINECDVVCGYNIRKYDWPILYIEFLRCGIELQDKVIIDVYEMIAELEKSKKLKDVYLRMIGKDLKGAHDALNDIQATKDVYDFLIKKLEI